MTVDQPYYLLKYIGVSLGELQAIAQYPHLEKEPLARLDETKLGIELALDILERSRFACVEEQDVKVYSQKVRSDVDDAYRLYVKERVKAILDAKAKEDPELWADLGQQ